VAPEFAVPVNPPNASPAVCVPDPAKVNLAVFKFPPLAQAPVAGEKIVELYSSVEAIDAVPLFPPKLKPAFLDA
jgi:hypothetical protein